MTAEIVTHHGGTDCWNIADVNCESGEAAEARIPHEAARARIRKLAAFGKRKKEKTPPVKESFSWIFSAAR